MNLLDLSSSGLFKTNNEMEKSMNGGTHKKKSSLKKSTTKKPKTTSKKPTTKKPKTTSKKLTSKKPTTKKPTTKKPTTKKITSKKPTTKKPTKKCNLKFKYIHTPNGLIVIKKKIKGGVMDITNPSDDMFLLNKDMYNNAINKNGIDNNINNNIGNNYYSDPSNYGDDFLKNKDNMVNTPPNNDMMVNTPPPNNENIEMKGGKKRKAGCGCSASTPPLATGGKKKKAGCGNNTVSGGKKKVGSGCGCGASSIDGGKKKTSKKKTTNKKTKKTTKKTTNKKTKKTNKK
jgi:hypothetical protein